MEALRARQPKELLRTDVFATVPPQDIAPYDLAELASNPVLVDPAKVLRVYRKHAAGDEQPDPTVLIRAFTQLGFLFDPNSFFSAADRQILTSHRHFRMLAHDLTQARDQLPAAAAPVLLYAMACLEYRCGPLLPSLLDAVAQHLHLWRLEVLTLLLHSTASLGLAGTQRDPITFDMEGGTASHDYGGTCREIAEEIGRRLANDPAGAPQEEAPLHDWARAAFAMVMAGQYDTLGPAGQVLPALVAAACARVGGREELDNSGWSQFFLYQTLYCVDVEKPASEEAVKQAMPMWIQERLHERWLDSIVLRAQPQGADRMQQDVDAALRRTNTQALLNCSAGRSWDEQHCWFAGFLLKPQVAIECDSMIPLGPGRPRPSGWLALKARVLKRMGYKVATLHKCFWERLSEDQKDDQVLRLRAEVGYEHDREIEKRGQPIRQAPYTKTERYKEKRWSPLKPQPSE